MTTVDVSVKAFREYLRGVKAKNTALKYPVYAKEFLRLVESSGYKSFAQMPPGLLSEFAAMLANQGKSPSTIRVQVYAVKKYLEWVKGKGIQVADQTRPDLPKKQIVMRESLPQHLISLYFRQADLDLDEPIRTAVMLLPCCGLRANELVGLRLDQIKRVEVKLRNGKTKSTLALRVPGKGNKERYVPLMEEGVEILTGYLAGWRRGKPGVWLFPKIVSRKSLLAKSGKKHISDRFLRLALQRMREPLGMEFTPHTMRRTYLTTLWRKGIDLKVIANIAGHASIQTTIDHYITMDSHDSVKALHNAGGALTE
jgi:site-specific recombinase XerD